MAAPQVGNVVNPGYLVRGKRQITGSRRSVSMWLSGAKGARGFVDSVIEIAGLIDVVARCVA